MDGRARVLHVDDDEHLLDVVAAHLQQNDGQFAVESTADVERALELFRTEQFDCVLSDYSLTPIDGIEFLERVRAEDPDIPFVLFTMQGNERVASEAIEAGATDYIPKRGTSDFDLLANRLHNAIDGYRTKQAAQRQERRLSELTEKATDMLWSYTADWEDLLFVNSAIEDIYGISRSKLQEEPTAFLDATHPDDRADVRDAMARLSEGEAVSIEYRVNEAESYGRWVWVDSKPVFDDDGDVARIVGFSRDVTERKRRERILSAMHDAAQEIERADDAASVYEILGETAEEVLDFDLVAVDVERDGYLYQQVWTLTLDDGEYYDRTSLEDDDTFAVRAYNRGETILIDDLRETDVAPADSQYRSVLTVPIGEFGTFQAVSRDVGAFDRQDVEFAEQLVGHAQVKLEQLADRTALEERTEELERQNERLDEFVGVVSHDLRNPVTVARGYVDALEAEYDDDRLEEIDWAVDRMETLIDDLLTLARNGETVDDVEPVHLDTIVENCWRLVSTGDATLTVTEDARILADRDRFRQLLENCLRNAVDHAGEDVTVRIGTLEDGFYIEDDGDGIPPEEREKVFQTGYTTDDDGTGFGLNIVEQIAAVHGWTVGVTDGSDGGARFTFTGVETPD